MQTKPVPARHPQASRVHPEAAEESQGPSLTALRREFIDELKAANRSQETIDTYMRRLEFFQRNTGAERLDEVVRPLVNRFLLDLREGALPASRKRASDEYVANNWRHLVAFLKWCRRRGYQPDASLFELDDFTGRVRFALPQPEVDENEPDRFDYDEIEAIRAVARATGYREQTLVELFLRTGIRLGEAARLRTEDVVGANLRIEYLARVGGGSAGTLRLSRTKKRKLRYPPLPTNLQRILAIYVERHRPVSQYDNLFLRSDGRPLTARGIDSLLDRLHRKAEVTGGAHKYRHTFATAFLRKNPGQLEKLRLILGHEDLKMVRRYARLSAVDLAANIDQEDPFS